MQEVNSMVYNCDNFVIQVVDLFDLKDYTKYFS